MRHEFSEVLNDLVDCFLVGDLLLLKRFKEQHGLPEDVASALTTSDSGDRAVLEGVVVPLVGIENHPYTVIFTLDGDTELLKTEAAFSIGGGYVLRVEHRVVMLYTWRILERFNDTTVNALLARYREPGRPVIEIDNGWYEVEILGGEVPRNGWFGRVRIRAEENRRAERCIAGGDRLPFCDRRQSGSGELNSARDGAAHGNRSGGAHMTPNTIHIDIRPATPADAPAIAAIHVASWQATYPGIMPAAFLAGLSVENAPLRGAMRSTPDGRVSRSRSRTAGRSAGSRTARPATPTRIAPGAKSRRSTCIPRIAGKASARHSSAMRAARCMTRAMNGCRSGCWSRTIAHGCSTNTKVSSPKTTSRRSRSTVRRSRKCATGAHFPSDRHRLADSHRNHRYSRAPISLRKSSSSCRLFSQYTITNSLPASRTAA